MKQTLAIGAIVFLTLGVAAAQDTTKAVTDLEHQWIKASLASDGDALAPLLATGFVALDADGSMHTKPEVVARTKKSKWVTNEIADVKVTVHGNTAIATGSWTGKGTDDMGKAVNTKERYADTWVKMADGKWQCVASASATIK
jgi:ketosteroid isomerase-like protein